MRGAHSPSHRIFVGVPDTPLFRRYIGKIEDALRDLSVGVLWVAPGGEVLIG